jgi:ferredoxin
VLGFLFHEYFDCVSDDICVSVCAVKMIRLVAFVLLPKNEEKFIIGKFTDLMK